MTETVTRQDVEDFLFQEAALLDEWRLDEWLGLFETDATYEVPTTDRPNEDPHRSQYYVWDDYELLTARVKRLKSKHAHAENPHSRTRRLVTNVRLGETRSVASGPRRVPHLQDPRWERRPVRRPVRAHACRRTARV